MVGSVYFRDRHLIFVSGGWIHLFIWNFVAQNGNINTCWSTSFRTSERSNVLSLSPHPHQNPPPPPHIHTLSFSYTHHRHHHHHSPLSTERINGRSLKTSSIAMYIPNTAKNLHPPATDRYGRWNDTKADERNFTLVYLPIGDEWFNVHGLKSIKLRCLHTTEGMSWQLLWFWSCFLDFRGEHFRNDLRTYLTYNTCS